MPLVDPRGLVARAAASGRAVVGANVSTVEMARGVIGAAESSGRPALIQFNRAGLRQIGGPRIASAAVSELARTSRAEVGLHLDHADTLTELREAVAAGFGSLMIDGSTLSESAHIKLAREAKALAERHDLALEAELGHVAGTEEGVTIGDASWTDPEAASRFVSATGVDWLAVAVGNVHGGAPPGGLQQERLAAIRERVTAPLVLHGASGLDQADLLAAVELGVAKINVGTALHRAMSVAMAVSLRSDAGDLRGALRAGEAAVTQEASRLLQSAWAVD